MALLLPCQCQCWSPSVARVAAIAAIAGRDVDCGDVAVGGIGGARSGQIRRDQVLVAVVPGVGGLVCKNNNNNNENPQVVLGVRFIQVG